MAFIEITKDSGRVEEVALRDLAKGQTFEVNGHIWMTTKKTLKEMATMTRGPAGELSEIFEAFQLDEQEGREILCIHLESGDLSHFMPSIEVIPTKSCKLNWSV